MIEEYLKNEPRLWLFLIGKGPRKGEVLDEYAKKLPPTLSVKTSFGKECWGGFLKSIGETSIPAPELMSFVTSARDAKDLQGPVILRNFGSRIHPSVQAKIVPALKRRFPETRFIVSTDSSLILSTARPKEILIFENRKPNVFGSNIDPRVLTNSEILDKFFGVASIYTPLGEYLFDYRFYARNPFRNDSSNKKLEEAEAYLLKEEVELPFPIAPRETK